MEVIGNGYYENLSFGEIKNCGLGKKNIALQIIFANEERNYHIFYQICSVAKRLPHLHLENSIEFHCINPENNSKIKGVDDLSCFDDTITTILHLRSININTFDIQNEDDDNTEATFISFDKHLLLISELLGTNMNAMRKWLCYRKIISMREDFLKPMNAKQAIRTRIALAKHIYSKLSNWIVICINNSLQFQDKVQCFINFQRYGKGFLARQRAEWIRCERTAIKIQMNIRG
ncbi:hypothetical protein HZH68_011222 [Vespula germanica]|uniref:Myosin motor domain-containing protein n=1 Tax=Vespula germanica TaxID=30212 RepID=A0A834JRM2_VESGE|nr:hypothetical protein HZH68_011222 [Vespula germanica]